MTTKLWGDEPELPFKIEPFADRAYRGFTKLERACIALKVPDPALDPKLRELILESRRLDELQTIRHFLLDDPCDERCLKVSKILSEIKKMEPK